MTREFRIWAAVEVHRLALDLHGLIRPQLRELDVGDVDLGRHVVDLRLLGVHLPERHEVHRAEDDHQER